MNNDIYVIIERRGNCIYHTSTYERKEYAEQEIKRLKAFVKNYAPDSYEIWYCNSPKTVFETTGK